MMKSLVETFLQGRPPTCCPDWKQPGLFRLHDNSPMDDLANDSIALGRRQLTSQCFRRFARLGERVLDGRIRGHPLFFPLRQLRLICG